MIWAIESDHFENKCGAAKHPLLHKVHNRYNGNLKDSFECNIEDEVIPAPSTLASIAQPSTTHSPTTQSSVLFKNL
jgi:hypothetical protein